MIFLLILPLLIQTATPLPPKKTESLRVEFDRGSKSRVRQFENADRCAETPCVITQWGAIRVPKEWAGKNRVELGMLHRGHYESLALFQQSTNFEQKVSERVFNKKPNRKIVDVTRLIETGQTDTLFMFGIILHYELDQADLLALKITSLNNPNDVREYYFRYHHDELKWDIDIAFIQPLNFFIPNPGNRIQAAYSTAAFSFSVAINPDPEKHYSLFSKTMRAFRINFFTGLLLRKEVATYRGDRITKDYFDGFAGIGLTFFDFLAVGYGGNLVRSPHTFFPFVGLELRHLMEFLRSFKADTHSQWEKYLKEETEKTAYPP